MGAAEEAPPEEAAIAVLRQQCPELLVLLDEFRDELGQGPGGQQPPFTDATWLAHLQLDFCLRAHMVDVFRSLRSALAIGNYNTTPASRKEALQLVESLQAAVKKRAAARLVACEQGGHPMVLRLAARYALSPAEADLFQLLFMHGASKSQCVKAALGGIAGKTEERELFLEVCGMSSLELEDFLDDKRTHIQDAVILSTMDDYEGKMMRMASEAISVLLLRPLTTEQRLKLSKTEVLNVMDAAPESRSRESQRPSGGGGDVQPATETDRANGTAPKRKRLSGDEEEEEEKDDVWDDGDGGRVACGGRREDGGELDTLSHLEGGPRAKHPKLAGGGAGGTGRGAGRRAARGDEDISAQLRLLEEELSTGALGPPPAGAPAGAHAEAGTQGGGAPAANGGGATLQHELKPYASSLEYLDDAFQVLVLKLRVAKARHKEDMKDVNEERVWYDSFRPATKVSGLRELRAKLRFAESRLQERLAVTDARRKEGLAELPRLEALAAKLGLDDFEKSIVIMLTGISLSPVVKSIFESDVGDGSFRRTSDTVQVKDILTVHFDSFKDQVLARPYFYKSSRLSVRGVIKMRAVAYSRSGGDLMDQQVELDRRMLDWIVGLDTEINELVEGSHLYTPKISMEQVVLAEEQKEQLLKTVDNFGKLKQYRQRAGLDDAVGGTAGLVILLCGASGTGKTMTVNALAHHLGKRVLLVDFQSLHSASGGSRGEDQSTDLRGLFRDAEMNDSVLFFDECEAIFAQRDRGGDRVLNALLTEIERFEGIVMLATNRPLDLDEAMHRRITHVSEFRPPDYTQRCRIWKVASEALPVAPDIDWQQVALRYELTGGYIKNALVSALLLAISREGTSPVITSADIVEGCSLQMRGSLQMKSFAHRVVPKNGLDALVLPRGMRAQLEAISGFEKARAMLMGQWGFPPERVGAACLFWGPQGSGKSAAAEALGFELGRPLKVVNCAQLISQESSARTGANVSAAFKDARLMDALLVLEDFQVVGEEDERTGAGNSSSVSAWSPLVMGLLLHEVERFPGICILVANNLRGSVVHRLDPQLLRRLRFLVEFRMPDRTVRAQMWRKLLPEKVPLADGVDFEELGKRFEITSGCISSAIVRACAQVALRPEERRKVTQKDLVEAAEAERDRVRDEVSEIALRAFV